MSMPVGHAGRVRIIYKTILRLHRGLPPELKDLGTAYTREEFKRHKKCSLAEAEVFITEWTHYAVMLAQQLGLKGSKTGSRIGMDFSEQDFDNFREDQIGQLYELKIATQPGENSESNQ